MEKAKLRFILVLILFSFTQNRLVLAFDNTPPVTSATLNGTIGSNNWYVTTVGVTLDAVDSDSAVASTEYWLDSDEHNVINYLPGAPIQVQFNVSSSGTHTVSYFSTNLDGVAESVKMTASFQVDTSAPANWRNFTATQAGNNHTYSLSITVDDLPSGLDVSSAYYNYTVDGINYGYYNTPTACNSGFVNQNPDKKPDEVGSGWKLIPTINPNTNGTSTVTLTTDAIDFCDSNWNLSEALQFYIRDLAGNETFKLQLLFGPWISINGDLHSQGSISFSAQGSADFLVSSKNSPITNMVSVAGWQVAPYDMPLVNMSYAYWYAKLGSPTTNLPSGKLPTVKGIYRVNGDFTIDSGTIPIGLSTTQNFGAVVFINGRLTVNNNFSLHKSSGLVFIVKDELRTNQSVNSIAGFYIVDDNVDFSYNGNNSTLFTLTGGIIGSGTWRFGKNLGGQNNVGAPSEKFVFQPGYLNNKDLISYLTVAPSYTWTEVAP